MPMKAEEMTFRWGSCSLP